MKKQNIIIILVMVILLSIAILMNFLPTYHNIFFILKHGSFYLFITGLTVILLRHLYLFIIKRYKVEGIRLSVLRVFTLVVLTATLFGTANMQINHIDKFESPNVQRCTFYDDYNNVIYKSRFIYSCPEIEIIEKTDQKLQFKVFEETSGTRRASTVNNVFQPKTEYNGKSVSLVEIDYDSKHRILNLRFTHSTLFEFYNENEHYYIHKSFIKRIENDYQEDSFKSKQQLYLNTSDKLYLDEYELFQYDFKDDAPYRTIEYESKVLNRTEKTKEFIVTVHADNNGTIVNEEIVRGTVIKSENEANVVFYKTSQSYYNSPYDRYEVIKTDKSIDIIQYMNYPFQNYHFGFKDYDQNKYVYSYYSFSNIDNDGVKFIYKEPISNNLMIETKWDLFRVVQHKLGKVAKVYQISDGNYEVHEDYSLNTISFYSAEMVEFYDLHQYGNNLMYSGGYDRDVFLQVNPLLEYLWD